METTVTTLHYFADPQRCPTGIYVCPSTGREYPVGRRAVYGRDCAGQPIVSEPFCDGSKRVRVQHTVSIDRDGYERRRGVAETHVRYPDGSAVLSLTRDGETRGYRRPADLPAWEDWQLDPSAATEAAMVAGIERPAATSGRWGLVNRDLQGRLKRWLVEVCKGAPVDSLWLHGAPGCGKTTALVALAGEAQAQGVAALYLSMPDIALQTQQGYSFEAIRDRSERLWTEARTTRILALDDVTAGVKPDSKDLRLRLHDLLDVRLRDGLPTVIADNTAPHLLLAAGYDARLCSRLAAAVAIDCGATDYRGGKYQPTRRADVDG